MSDDILTQQEENFCHAYLVAGGNAAAAAREVGLGNQRSSAAGMAWVNKPKIKRRIEELRQEVKDSDLMPLDEVLRDVRRLLTKAENARNWTAAKGLAQLKAELGGHIRQKLDVNFMDDWSDEKLAAEMRAALRIERPELSEDELDAGVAGMMGLMAKPVTAH
jgi:phage terminase small subunit